MKTFGGGFNDDAFDVVLEANGDLTVGGSWTEQAERYYYLVRTNTDGDTLATRKYGPFDGSLAPSRMIATSDGGYLFVGTIDGLPPYTFNSDLHLMRVNADLTPRWSTRAGSGPVGEVAAAVAETSDGFFVAGHETTSSSWTITVYAIDSLGALIWRHHYPFGPNEAERSSDIIATSDGHFVIAGEGQDASDSYAYDQLLIKIDAAADTVWARYEGSGYPYDERAERVVETSDGGFLTAGRRGEGTLFVDCHVVKSDMNGSTTWTHDYGGAGNDVAFSAIEMAGGGYAVCGVHKTTTWKSLVMRYDTNGDTLWTYRWGGDLESTYAYDLVELPDGDLIVIGTTTTDSSGVDLFMARVHVSPMGVADRLDAGASLTVRPNPTRETAELVVTLEKPSALTVRLIDLSGRTLFTKDLGQRPAGSTLVPVNVSDLEAGTYQCHVTTGTGTTSIPLMVQ